MGTISPLRDHHFPLKIAFPFPRTALFHTNEGFEKNEFVWLEANIRVNQGIYLHRSSPLLENGLDRPKNRYGRYGFPSFVRVFNGCSLESPVRVDVWMPFAMRMAERAAAKRLKKMAPW